MIFLFLLLSLFQLTTFAQAPQEHAPKFFQGANDPGVCSPGDFYYRTDTNVLNVCNGSNAVVKAGLGFTAEDTANKDTTVALGTSDTHYPSQKAVKSYVDTNYQPTVPTSYTVTAIANATNGCANANGCWQVNGVLGAAKSAALTQAVVLFQLPANGHVFSYRVKSATACTGTATLKTGVGTASSTDFYLTSATGYDLKAAVSNTNVTTAAPEHFGSDTAAAVNVVASLTATTSNVDQIVTGCSFKVTVLSVTLP